MGLRAVSDPKAIGYYMDVSNEKREFDRKVRTVLRGLTVFFNHLEFLNPFRYGLFSYQYLCHKLLRWAGACFSFHSTRNKPYAGNDILSVLRHTTLSIRLLRSGDLGLAEGNNAEYSHKGPHISPYGQCFDPGGVVTIPEGPTRSDVDTIRQVKP